MDRPRGRMGAGAGDARRLGGRLWAGLMRHVEAWTLLLGVLVSLLALAFVALAEEVLEGETHALDTALLLLMRSPGDLSDPIGPPWVEEMGRDFTALGGVGVLTTMAVVAAGLLWLQGRRRTMLFLLTAVGGGILMSTFFKRLFDRPRPDLVPYESLVHTASFPSGHSMMAAVTYLTLAVLLARGFPDHRIKAYILFVALVLTTAVGVSRVYLGVHWPSDVLAGWALGAAWALGCLLVARWLGRHRAIEPSEDENPAAREPAVPGDPRGR